MNENNENNRGTIHPYKATGNLNTAIGNPSVNINDTMNINIKSMATNETHVNNNQGYVNNTPLNKSETPKNVIPSVNPITTESVQTTQNNTVTPINNIENTQVRSNINQNNESNSYVKKTYVTADNKSKKKNITLNLGSEFKIALLIMVILLVFVFLLPMITDIFNGY